MKYRLGDLVIKEWNSWDSVPRMPQAVGAAILKSLSISAATLGVSAATFTAITYVVGYLATSAVTSFALRALAPKPSGLAGGLSGQTLTNQVNPNAPHEIVYGQVRKGGTITYQAVNGNDNKYLHMVIVLAAHEVEEIGTIYLNDEVATLDGDGFVTSGNWDKKIRIRKYDGTQTTADSALSSLTDSNFIGRKIAYLAVRMEYDQDVFSSGIPTITARVKGKKVYDPRNSTTAYSNNAALIVRDYITSYYGLSDSSIDDTALQAAANESDENVSLDGGGTQDRYTIDGVVQGGRPHSDVLNDMMSACAGSLFWGTGKWTLKVGAYSAPVKTLTMDDLRSEINLTTRVPMQDNFNIVRGQFANAADQYVVTDFPEVRSSAFITEDNGEEVPLDLELPFTTNAARAQRLAKLTLFRAREQMTLTADFGMEAFEVEVGDIVALPWERYSWDNISGMDDGKEFEVVGWKLQPSQDAGDLRVNLTLRETSEAAFDWNAEETAIIGNNANFPDATTGTAINGLTIADGGGEVQGDGSVINSLVASWTASTSQFVTRYEVQWGQTSSANRTTFFTSDNSVVLSPVVDGVEYTVRVRAITVGGFRGAFQSGTVTAGGDTTAPAKVTSGSLEAVGVLEGIEVKWENPADADFSHVEIYESNDSNFSNATQVGRSSGNTFLRGNIVGGTTKYFWVRTKDFSGNPTGSATVGQTRGPVSATSKVVTASDVGAAVIGYENLAEDVDVLLQDARKKIDDLGTQSLTEVLGRYKDRKRSEERDAIITQDMSAGITEANQAVADLRTELVSQFDGNLAAIVDQLTTVADDASANATSIEGLIADVAGNTGAIAEINTVSADSSSALARSVASLDVDVTDNTASIVAINDVSASSDSAAAQSLFNLNASVSGLETDVSNAQADITAAEADILQINNVSADSSSAIAQSVNDLNVALEFDDGTETYGRITEIADLRADLTGVEAKYGVTVDANGNIGGFQLLSGEGGSAFNVAADQFNIFNPDGDTSGRPFTVFSTLREVDGITYPIGVYMDQAYIDSANIVDGTITNAKIGNVIQSENYSAGSAGWKINKDGSAEFNGVVISRQLLVDSGTYTHGSASISRRTTIGESFSVYLESTNTPISAWAGANKTYICNVEVTGTISANTGDPPDVFWGWTGEILPLTKWSGNQTLRLKLTFWTKKVTSFTNLKAKWKIYEVT